MYETLGSISSDGHRLVYLDDSGSESQSIWKVQLDRPGGDVVSHGKLMSSRADQTPELSPDNTRIAFTSGRSGSPEIWTADLDGENPMQLTFLRGELLGCARYSPDGNQIAFDRGPGSPSQIWLMDSDGRNPHALISTVDDNDVPSWSRDGRSIYFASWRSGYFALWKQRLTLDHRSTDGNPVLITTHSAGFFVVESYDGKTLYFTRRDADGIWAMPIDGGQETRVTAAPVDGAWGHWAVAEAGLYFLDCRTVPHCTLEFYDFSTGKSAPIFQIEHEVIATNPGLSTSRDGRTVLYTEYTSGINFIAMTEILP